jgi:hypothetical protein
VEIPGGEAEAFERGIVKREDRRRRRRAQATRRPAPTREIIGHDTSARPI